MQPGPLHDGHGRRISDLRVSITDRCDLRCTYCLPAAGIEWIDRASLLSDAEVIRLVSVLASLGVTDVRVTGGEPLIRPGVVGLVAAFADIRGIQDLSITTNGVHLAEHASGLIGAGIMRFNVSLDALTHESVESIARRDVLDRVLDGLFTLRDAPERPVVKVNVVAIRGITEDHVERFVEFARGEPFQVRFIEQMPLGADHQWDPADVLTGAEVLGMIQRHHPVRELPRAPHATARVFRFMDGPGEVGFINPVSEPFCADCNRLRLTADGHLRTCLFSHRETNLRELIRAGASDEELASVVREAVWRKELKHTIGEPGFVRPPRTMSQIGG